MTQHQPSYLNAEAHQATVHAIAKMHPELASETVTQMIEFYLASCQRIAERRASGTVDGSGCDL